MSTKTSPKGSKPTTPKGSTSPSPKASAAPTPKGSAAPTPKGSAAPSPKGSKPPSRKPSKETVVKGVQVKTKPKHVSAPCPWLCNMVPTNVPGPGPAQTTLHPRKDVFVLKVAKVGPTGDRRCKMELELVTPKGPEKKPPCRIDTRETQCDPDPPPCCCMKPKKKRK